MIGLALLTINERRRMLFWSVVGMVATVGIEAAVWPSFRNAGVEKIYETLPKGLQSLFGIDAQAAFSGAAFLNAEIMSLMLPLVLLGVGIAAANGTTVGDEVSGRMDVLLSAPITRSRLLLGRAIGVLAMLAVIAACTGLSMLVGSVIVDLGLSVGNVVGAMVTAWLLAAAYTALAFALAGWVGRRSGIVIGVAAAAALASWLVSSLGDLVTSIRTVSQLLDFHAYAKGPTLVTGAHGAAIAQLAGETIVLLLIALAGFARRDL